MISLANEYTDSKGRHAKGWLFFDGKCRFCTRMARWLAPILSRRGFCAAPLEDPRVGALLGLGRHEQVRDLRFLLSDGTLYGGADAVIAVARQIAWVRPLIWLSMIPGMTELFRTGYCWIAKQKRCAAARCKAAEASGI
jgi:predicted DCC family thiol-disulfide oxidoreductase YuxK